MSGSVSGGARCGCPGAALQAAVCVRCLTLLVRAALLAVVQPCICRSHVAPKACCHCWARSALATGRAHRGGWWASCGDAEHVWRMRSGAVSFACCCCCAIAPKMHCSELLLLLLLLRALMVARSSKWCTTSHSLPTLSKRSVAHVPRIRALGGLGARRGGLSFHHFTAGWCWLGSASACCLDDTRYDGFHPTQATLFFPLPCVLWWGFRLPSERSDSPRSGGGSEQNQTFLFFSISPTCGVSSRCSR